MAASWVLVPALKALRAEFDQLAPSRDKASDGAIGDTAHAAKGTSDHLPDDTTPALKAKDADRTPEVHAIDVDKDLRKSGWTMMRCVQLIVTRARTGLDDRLAYVIFDRIIWTASSGWTARAYNGANPHDKHAHFSAKYGSKQEADTRPWGLLEAARATPAASVKPAQNAPGSRLLKQGMTGPDVSYVQRWTGAKDDGSFGASTTERVKRYQRIVGLVADGAVGAKTWSRILGRKVTF